MNLKGYPTTLRPAMTAEEFVAMFGGLRARGPISDDSFEAIAAKAASFFDVAAEDDEGLVGPVG